MLRYLLLSCLVLSAGRQALSQNLDVEILKKINPNHEYHPAVGTLSSSAYTIGIGLPIALTLAGEISGNKELRGSGLRIAGAVLASAVITEMMKRAATRERPADKYPGVIFRYQGGKDNKSLPSGHTALAFSLATSLSLECRKWYVTVPAFTWAASIGYSRMYLGAHYPSDVLGGALVGTGTAIASHWLNKKLFARPKKVPVRNLW